MQNASSGGKNSNENWCITLNVPCRMCHWNPSFSDMHSNREQQQQNKRINSKQMTSIENVFYMMIIRVWGAMQWYPFRRQNIKEAVLMWQFNSNNGKIHSYHVHKHNNSEKQMSYENVVYFVRLARWTRQITCCDWKDDRGRSL